MSHITVIYGPTASGKTRKAQDLVEENHGILLSFDSRHVYKDMDIVTGKDLPDIDPSRCFGFDLISPDEDWSTYHFYMYAKDVIGQAAQNNIPVVLFGGSWPFAQVLANPPESLGAETQEEVRKELESLPLADLQIIAQTEAPLRWAVMNESDRANPRRLSRAIEVARLGIAQSLPPLFTEFELFLMETPLHEVEENIAKRVEERWNHGALEETGYLMEKYSDWSWPAFSSTGYGPIRQFLEGKIDEARAKELWILEERQYAKRQFTWVKKIASASSR